MKIVFLPVKNYLDLDDPKVHMMSLNQGKTTSPLQLDVELEEYMKSKPKD
jgi:hypothetical protein